MKTPIVMGTKTKLRHKFFLFILTFLSLRAFSQSDPAMDKLAVRLHSLSKNSLGEQVYLQTSKGIYERGEDLWFKAYVLDAQSLIPSLLSQTLYLQLISANTKQAVWQEQYEVKDGFAGGQVYLRDTLPEGDYLLETFTAHSFYADNHPFLAARQVRIKKDMQPVPAVNTAASPGASSATGKNIQFGTFPEGGKLIPGIPGRLAFKTVDPSGNPVAVTGTLFQDGQALQQFKSEHAGMGSLQFTPLAGKKYHIRLSQPKTDSIFTLPEIAAGGMSLRLASRDSSYLEFIVAQSPGSKAATIYLRGQLRGLTCCVASGKLAGELKIRIPLSEFSQQGIAEFTLFNESLLPVAERLVYVHPEKQLYIRAELSKQLYELREKATLKIKVSDERGQPVAASLGLSVYDKLYLNPKDPQNILGHYYLSAQLKGKIYDPAYYFDEQQQGRQEALDLLLLTQGWRNYIWSEENLAATQAAVLSPLISDGTAGAVHFTKKLKQAPKGEQLVMATTYTKNTHTDLIAADTAGRFMAGSVTLKAGQGGYVYLKPMGSPDFGPRISLDDPFQKINNQLKDKATVYPLPNMAEKAKEEPFRPPSVGPKVVRLSEVVIKARGSQVFRDKYMGHLDSLAKLDLNSDYVCVSGYLNCPIHENDSRNTKPIEGKVYKQYIGFRWINNKGGAYTASSETNLEYHYPKITEEELLKQNNLTRIKGYYAHREFYQPDYDKVPNDMEPDTRNTLLWAPSVITDEKGEATLTFYCSDFNTGFVGKIEGVSGDGLLGKKDFEFVVQKTKPSKLEK